MIKVVYLSDDSDASSTNIEYMEKYGNIDYAVFSEPDEAIQYLKKNPESLVFFEHSMLRCGIGDIYSIIRRLGIGGAFVVITAEDDCDEISNMYKNGISAVLIKPFDYEVFSDILDYYQEYLSTVYTNRVSSNFWISLSKVFTRKDSELAKLLLEYLEKEDASANSIAQKLNQPEFLVRQCLNELTMTRDVVSYIKSKDNGAGERIFSKRQL